MAGPPPSYRVELTFVDAAGNVLREEVRTGVKEGQLNAWQRKRVWTDNPGLYWIQLSQEN